MKKASPLLGIVLILVVIFGTIYTVGQQIERTDANYPQVQLAEDTANSLNMGTNPEKLISQMPKVLLDKSLAAFVNIYDRNGQLVSGNGYLNRQVSNPPTGVLTASKGQDYNMVTWQPAGNVRIAAITVAADRYYVLSGRSLKEVEKNETKTLDLSFLGGIVSLIILGVTLRFNQPRHKAR